MAIAGAITSFFILVVILIYSTIVWKSLDQYFKDEFKKHLEQDKNYQRLQKEKLDIVDSVISTEERVEGMKSFEENLVGQGICNKQKMPADKYRKQEDEDDYVDDGEVCPFVLPVDLNDNNGR